MTRGMRNNNPGNIRFSSNNLWSGKVPLDKNTDYNHEFEQFVDLSYGIRACMLLIKHYIVNGCNTVESIISRYAPSTENRTQDYIDFVMRNMSLNCCYTGKSFFDYDDVSNYHPFTKSTPITYGTYNYYSLIQSIFMYESRFCPTLDSLKSIFNSFNLY